MEGEYCSVVRLEERSGISSSFELAAFILDLRRNIENSSLDEQARFHRLYEIQDCPRESRCLALTMKRCVALI